MGMGHLSLTTLTEKAPHSSNEPAGPPEKMGGEPAGGFTHRKPS